LIFAFAVKALTGLTPAAPAEDAARIVERTKAREDLEAENKKRLETYAWVDKAKGSVQIPIKQAMELTAAELKSQSPAPAGPIVPVVAPAAAPAPAAATNGTAP